MRSSLGIKGTMNLPFHGPPPNGPYGPGNPGGVPPVQRQVGHYFRFALPAGWRVQENANMLCLNSPDGQAAIMNVGLSGMMYPMSPDQFVAYALNMQQMQLTGILNGQQIPPPPGCTQAGRFEITYAIGPTQCRGIVLSYVAVGYGQCNASITLAAAQVGSWPAYAQWLPQLAMEVGPAGSQTYGAGQIASDNLRQSMELGQKFHEVNDYTQQQWQQVTNERWASDERRNFEFRENLGGIQTYTNPYDNHRTVELSTQYRFYWVNRRGEIVGSDDPGYDPRVGSTDEWSQMPQYGPPRNR